MKEDRGREHLSKLDMHNFGTRWDASESGGAKLGNVIARQFSS